MDDICTVRSLLASLEPQPMWTLRYSAWTCPFCGEHDNDECECRRCHYNMHDHPEHDHSTEPTPEWGDLEDHGWMGTSTRNNPTIRDNFPASFG